MAGPAPPSESGIADAGVHSGARTRGVECGACKVQPARERLTHSKTPPPALGLGHAHNKRPGVIWAKLAACLVLTHLLWMNRSVFDLVWRPLRPLLAYTNPARPEGDPLHEWFFRTGLDRYVWVHGMACAALLPRWEAALEALEALGWKARRGARAAVLAVCALVGYAWYAHVFSKPKLEYNALHPYTSWIPITGGWVWVAWGWEG